jgi:hypothetical protein
MSTTRREITSAELSAIWALAADYPDLRVIPARLAEVAALRMRVTAGDAAVAEVEDLRRRVVKGESAIAGVRESQAALQKALGQLGLARGNQS